MAQQVEIAGVLFNNVPYIQCPDGNGVYHKFLDTTIASNAAAASDIAQGKQAYVNDLLVTGTNQGGGGGGLEYETGTWTPAQDTADYTIGFTGTHTIAPFYYFISDNTGTYSNVTYSNFGVQYINFNQLFGGEWRDSSGSPRYATVSTFYRGSSTTQITAGSVYITHPYTDTGSGSSGYPRYWTTETGIRAYTNNNSRYWRAGRAYKWIAVWAPTS